MVAFVSLVVLFAVYIWIVIPRSRVMPWLSLIIISFAIAIVLMQLYIAKFTSGTESQEPGSILLSFDYKMQNALKGVTIDAHSLIRWFNFSLISFTYLIFVFSLTFGKPWEARKKIFLYLGLAVVPVEILMFYDPFLIYYVVIEILKNDLLNETTVVGILRFMHQFNNITIHVYLIGGMGIILLRIIKARLKVTRISNLFVFALLLPLCIVSILIFLWLPKTYIDIYSFAIRLSLMPIGFKVGYNYFEWLPIFIICTIVLDLYLIINKQVLHYFRWSKNNKTIKQLKNVHMFYGGVLHTVKNELLAIKMVSERIMYSNNIPYKELSDISRICESSITHLEELNEQIRPPQVNLAPLDLIEIVNKVVYRSRKIYGETNFNSNVERCDILGDSEYLTQAINNIVENAWEATQVRENAPQYVGVEVYAEDVWVVVGVKDKGIGMTHQQMKDAFRPFTSIKNSRYNWGIGLSYSYSIIYLHHGDINVESRVNAGTCFEIVLPRIIRR